MATSPVYNDILKLISNYMEKDKAVGVVERQLTSKNLKAETLATKDLAAVINSIATATGLYVPDPARRDELKGKLKAMAG